MRSVLLPALLTVLASANERPNVVVFLVDDLGTLDTHAFGSEDLLTPHLDQLAEEGVRFTRFYAHTVCCPARALLLTGRHPQRGGVNRWTQGDLKAPTGVHLHLGEVTLAEAFRDAGYRTGLFGKWHLGAAREHGPTRQGFDEFFGHRGGFIDNENHHCLHGEGFHDLYRGTEEVFAEGEYFPDLVTDHAIDFVQRHAQDPFFLLVALSLPHYPEQPDAAFDEPYADLPEPRRSYARVVSTVDERIGRVLAALEEQGLREDALIAFLSDNGHSTERFRISQDEHASGLPKGHRYGAQGGGGNTGVWRGQKGSFYEGGLRVPAILVGPRDVTAGSVRDQAVHAGDLYPTLLELAGVPLPEVELDGRSLVPLLRDPRAPSPHAELHWQWFEGWAVALAEWKLIGGSDPAANELLRLSDPAPELANHAADHPELVAQLRARHETWADEVHPERGLARLAALLGDAPSLRVCTDLVPSRGRAYVDGERLYFQVPAGTPHLSFPRLNNPLRRLATLAGDELRLHQDGRRWWCDLEPKDAESVVVLELVGEPKVPHQPAVLRPDDAGEIVLPAHEAQVFGEKLCYEPQPHKNTLGYWVEVDDWARWEFETVEAGTYAITLLQGCGEGHGGSRVEVSLGEAAFEFVVEDTGHFQNFVPRMLGHVQLEPGQQRLELRPRHKAAGAVMDVREVRLRRVY